jgi:hypothetical protein
VGRFLSEDPARLVDGLNLQQYARNNSVKMIDPTGLCSCSDPCPSGEWTFDPITVSIGAVFNLQFGFGKITCKGGHASRWAKVGCVLVGPYVSLSIGLSVQVRGATFSGPCRPEDLGGVHTYGMVFGFGTPSATTSKEGGLPDSIGGGLGPTAGVASADCYATPL